jgi:GNAT superfamily N-acetyltransferase
VSAGEIRALDEVGYRIWVAPEVEELDGWRLRFAGGLTSRANAVFPNAAGVLPLEEKLERVEAWYAERGAAARFQLTAGSLPDGLAPALARRGYAPGEPVGVLTSELPDVEADDRVELADSVDGEWLRLWAASRGFDDVEVVRALMCGSPGRTVFARVPGVAIGRAVACDGWLGITSMLTVPEARRQGLGRAILATLLAWGRAAGARRGFLQTDSPAAKALYAQLGFAERYAYRYWVRHS